MENNNHNIYNTKQRGLLNKIKSYALPLTLAASMIGCSSNKYFLLDKIGTDPSKDYASLKEIYEPVKDLKKANILNEKKYTKKQLDDFLNQYTDESKYKNIIKNFKAGELQELKTSETDYLGTGFLAVLGGTALYFLINSADKDSDKDNEWETPGPGGR